MRKTSLLLFFILHIVLLQINSLVYAEDLVSKASVNKELSEYDACLLRLMQTGAGTLLLSDIRKQCQQSLEAENDSISFVTDRIVSDTTNVHKPFTFMAYHKNYLLFAAWNSNKWESELYQNTNGEEQLDLQQTEVQFQLSVKTPLMIDILGTKIDAYAAYTGRSFWQAYNTHDSSPFRETNHEPELWVQRYSHLHIGELRNIMNSVGLAHQSNGQGGDLSRSWNRVYSSFDFIYGNLGLTVKSWFRLPESEDDDNNPDITDYLGHGHLVAAYTKDDHVFSLMCRNNLESGFSKGAVEIGWSFPLWKYDYLKGYIQYFTGYGESMIDYDHYVNRIGVGVLITDIL